MNTQQEKNSIQTKQTNTSQPEGNFDFDQWAGAVKQQMIASLKRRGSV